jgi:hypothetical protein
MPIGTKRNKIDAAVSEPRRSSRLANNAMAKQKAEQPEHAAAVVAAVIVAPRKTQIVRTKMTMAAVRGGRTTGQQDNATVLEPRRNGRRTKYAMAKQLYENGHFRDTTIGNVVADEAAMAAVAPVLMPPPPPPVRCSVHWPEVVVSDVFVFDDVSAVTEERASRSSYGNLFVKYFVLVLLALVFAGEVYVHYRGAGGPSAIIDSVIPSEMPSFCPRGGRDVLSIVGEPCEWRPVANSTRAMVPRPATAASTAVAIRTVIPSEMSSFFFPRGGIDEQSIGGEQYEWRSVPTNETAALVVVDPVVAAVDTVILSEKPFFRPRGSDEPSIGGEPYRSMRWWVASAIAYLVWSVMVGYWSCLHQAPITTVVTMVVGLALRRHFAERWAIARKERYVIRHRALVYHALYETHGPVSADALWARVAHRAFPSDQKKRQQLKAKVWKHIVRDATSDDRINIEQVQGKAIWEWDDCVPPAPFV